MQHKSIYMKHLTLDINQQTNEQQWWEYEPKVSFYNKLTAKKRCIFSGVTSTPWSGPERKQKNIIFAYLRNTNPYWSKNCCATMHLSSRSVQQNYFLSSESKWKLVSNDSTNKPYKVAQLIN